MIDGNHKLVDCTWGSGGVNEEKKIFRVLEYSFVEVS